MLCGDSQLSRSIELFEFGFGRRVVPVVVKNAECWGVIERNLQLAGPVDALWRTNFWELIRLRRALPELTDPRFEHTLAAGQGDDGLAVFRLDRGAGIRSPIGGIVSVCAAIREGASFDVGPDAALELATSPAARLESGVLTLPPHSAAIVRVRAARAR